MIIQINTDVHIENNARTTDHFSELVSKDLDHYAEHLTRVEVHFSDINAGKSGPEDKKCVIEARMKNREPLAVTAQDEALEKAFSSAMDKVKSSMRTIVGKMQEKR